MKAVVLAAGKGTRLKPLTYGIPKPLLPVGGKPVIDYVIKNLLTCKEIDTIYVAVSYLKENIENYLKHVEHDGVKIETVMTLGWDTGGDLHSVIVEKNIKERVAVAYGDNVTELDVGAMNEFHKKKKAQGTVALFRVPWDEVDRFGIAELEDGFVSEFKEKPKRENAKTNLANAGYYILEPGVFPMLPHKKAKIEKTVFPILALEKKMAGYIYNPSHWIDIGTTEAYRKANKMIEGVLAPEKR